MNFQHRQSWAIIVFLWICGIFGAIQIAKVSVIYQDLADHLGAEPFLAGLILGAVSIVPMILGIFSGPVFQRLGYKNILIVSLLLGGALSAHQAFETNLIMFLISRVLEGFSLLGIVVVAPILITRVSSVKIISLSMSLWATFFGFAFAIAGWAAPMMLSLGDISGFFLAHTAVLILLAIGVFWVIPGSLNNREAGNHPVQERKSLASIIAGLWKDLVRSARKYAVLSPGLVFLIHTALYTPILTFLPPIITHPESVASMVFYLSVVSILGTIASGPIAQYVLNPIRTMILGLLGMGVILLVLFVNPELDDNLALGLSMILIFFSGMIQGSVFSSIGYLNASDYDRVVSNSTTVQLGNIGSTFGPIVFATIAVTGYSALLIGFLILVFFGLLAAFFIGKTRTPIKQAQVAK